METTNRQLALNEMQAKVAEAEKVRELRRLDVDEESIEELELMSPLDVLSVDVSTTVRVLLSCGGPTTAFEFHYGTAGELVRTTYTTTDNPNAENVAVEVTEEEAFIVGEALSFDIDSLDLMIR